FSAHAAYQFSSTQENRVDVIYKTWKSLYTLAPFHCQLVLMYTRFTRNSPASPPLVVVLVRGISQGLFEIFNMKETRTCPHPHPITFCKPAWPSGPRKHC